MSRASQSMFFFSFWIGICGITLFAFPDVLLDLAEIEMNPDILARLFGMVLIFLSTYYFLASKREYMQEFYRWTTYTRLSAFIIVIILWLANLAQPVIIAFAFVDFLGALWTIWGLSRDTQG